MAELNLEPEFTTDESVAGTEEVKQPETAVTPDSEEKDTPAEPPADKQPADTGEIPAVSADTRQPEIPQDILDKAVERATMGLRTEISDLRVKLRNATGEGKRDIQEVIVNKQQQIDELQDIAVSDVDLIDRVLRAKGYITREEASKLTYEQVKQDVLDNFLAKYPEYKSDHDAGDQHWSALQKELSFYRMPENPRQIMEILERAHRAITKPAASGLNIPAKKRVIQVAGVGSGGVQRSSSRKSLDPEHIRQLRDGGFTDEDIKKIESRME